MNSLDISECAQNYTTDTNGQVTHKQAIQSFERELIFAALQRVHGNASQAARELGITYRMFRYRASVAGLKPEKSPIKSGKFDPFLKAWPSLRLSILKKHGSRCMCCGATPYDGVRIDVDHIKPRGRYPELELDPSNLQILCKPCHMAKGPHDETDFRISV